ncbi:hypothetical protein BDV98DRAFT_529405 [Pterulicium gracile]|uniref:BSD domain-containing protein n=1 Tax=Pterulicium gracile TaxID=1884261 RepID=A0A5C3QKD0_9AGAR|nr:hypothetical protein BDV98DRAFT_529405 [Pterula gracilis]
MSFLDPYDISNAGTATPPLNPPPEKSLNEEVTQVIGQLGSWWGGFKQQSQTAIMTGRKGFADVVVNAQKELGRLAAEPEPSSSSAQHERSATGTQDPASDNSTPTAEKPTTDLDSDLPSSSSAAQPTPSSTSGYSMQGLLTALQSTIPPNVVNAVQNTLPESVRQAAAEGVDFGQLRTTLSAEFQRVQGVTRAQAEEYVHKSEAFLREAVKEAQEVLKDAVKVIPPEEQATSSGGMIWDGSDVWMLPAPVSAAPSAAEGGEKGKAREASSSSTLDSQGAVVTRAESLLKTLKQNPAIIAHDPEADEVVKKVYLQWAEEESRGKDSAGIWSAKGKAALTDDNDGQALRSTHDKLVPSQMPEETFWQRYFFRVHQIERNEEKRKEVLLGSLTNDEDIKWEDDDDDDDETIPEKSKPSATVSSSATPTKPLAASAPQPEATPNTLAADTPSTSTRASSDESYDVVSSTNSVSVEPKPVVKQPAPAKDDSDSDEEDDEDEDDSDDDEDEDDSDWE